MHRRSGVPPGRPARVGLPPHGLVSVAVVGWLGNRRRPRTGPEPRPRRGDHVRARWCRATEGRMPRSKRSPLSSPGRQIVGPPSTKRVVARDRAPARTRLTRPVEGSVAIRTKSLRAPAAGVSGPAPSATSSMRSRRWSSGAESPSKPRTSSTKRRSRPIWSGMITAPTVESASRGETAGDAETAYTCSRSPRASEAAMAMVAKAVDRPDRGPPMIRQGGSSGAQVSPSWSCSSGRSTSPTGHVSGTGDSRSSIEMSARKGGSHGVRGRPMPRRACAASTSATRASSTVSSDSLGPALSVGRQG